MREENSSLNSIVVTLQFIVSITSHYVAFSRGREQMTGCWCDSVTGIGHMVTWSVAETRSRRRKATKLRSRNSICIHVCDVVFNRGLFKNKEDKIRSL